MYSEDFRAGVITFLMYDKVFLSSVAPCVKPRFFTTKLEQHVVRAILDHYRDSSKPPKRAVVLERVLNYLETSPSHATKVSAEAVAEFLDSCKNLRVEIQDNKDYFRDTTLKFCRQMALRDAILESVDLLEKGEELDRIEELIRSASATGSYVDEDLGFFLLEEAGKIDGSLLDIPRAVVPTGRWWIDRHCKGGPARKELWAIAAPPNTGKSTALVDVGAGHVRSGYKVVHFTCEMSKPVVGGMYRKNLTKKTDLDISKMSEEEQVLMREWLHKLRKRIKSDVYIAEYPTDRLTIDEIIGVLTVLESQKGFKPDVVMVDYADLLKRPSFIKEDHRQIEWLYKQLRALASETNSLVWTASQVNVAGAEKPTAMNTDISGAFAKNMIVDGMIGLNQTVAEQEAGVLRTMWLKNRAGRKYMTNTMLADFERCRFEKP